jgi:hypothetical protein
VADKQADIILGKLRKSRSKREARETVWHELDAFDRNEQWDIQSAPTWLPKPVTNFIHLVKYTKRAALAVENPTGKLRAMSPEGVERVNRLDRGFQYVWERIKARKVVRENVETKILLGTAIAHVHWDEYKEGKMGSTILGDKGYRYEGEICVKEIDPASFYPDPNAFSLEECAFIGIKERKPLDWIKKHPKFKGANLENMESKNDPAERGEIYNRDYTTETTGLIDFISFYEKEPNEEGGFNYKVTYLAGDKILHTQPLKPNRYPFALLHDFKQRQDFWAMSTCEFILDNQKIINKVESIITMIGTLMQNPQKVVNKQSGIDPKEVAMYGMAPGHTFVSNMDAKQAISYVEPPQIPTVLFNLLESAKNNIREITGLTEAYMGQAVGSLQTSGGVQSLIERSTMRDRDQMYDLEMYIEQLSTLIIDFMVTYYETERQIRIMGEGPDDYTFEPFLGTDFADTEYDMFIDVSSKAPMTRVREQQEAKELLNMQGQYGFPVPVITPQEALNMMDFAKKDEILKRMNMDEMRNKTDEALQVANFIAEAQAQGLPPEQIQEMAVEMFNQLETNPQGMGSTSNSNNVQMQQQGAM